MIRALLGERYRLGERIADGGMGSVYRAVDENLGRPVAVKVLRRELADEPAFLERFRREARAAAALSHPGVAGVYDYGELGGSAFIVMELVEGETLAERIAATGRLPWRRRSGSASRWPGPWPPPTPTAGPPGREAGQRPARAGGGPRSPTSASPRRPPRPP